MLILNRKSGESLIINDKIKIMVLSAKKNQIRIGIEAPKEIKIHRDELDRKILDNYKKEKMEGKHDYQ